MEFFSFLCQELRMSRDQLFRALHVAVGDRDFDRVMTGEVDLHDSTGFRDMTCTCGGG